MRTGAALDAAGKAELGRITTALPTPFTQLQPEGGWADENTWTVIENEAGVAGLPASNNGGRGGGGAQPRHRRGWALVNTRSSVDPFLSFADDRALRERWGKVRRTRRQRRPQRHQRPDRRGS